MATAKEALAVVVVHVAMQLVVRAKRLLARFAILFYLGALPGGVAWMTSANVHPKWFTGGWGKAKQNGQV